MTLEEVKQNCKQGWTVNPKCNGIINGINRCEGECPCNNDSEDKHCPCSNYRLHDKCCCGLYLKNTVKVINESDNELPKYETNGSAGLDLRYAGETKTLQPLERGLFDTGLKIELPKDTLAYVQSRSGLALKKGLFVLNSPGLIDQDYRNNVGVILCNLSNEPITIEHGDRIAQLVVLKYEQVKFLEVDVLETTERGEGGFGHTGMK